MRIPVEFTYDACLVAASIAIAILGSFTGLVVTTGIREVDGREAMLRVVLGGLGIGGGIWATHFVAMLAVTLPIPLSYDPAKTAASAIVAVTFTAAAFAIFGRAMLRGYTLPASALFLGGGIAGMHYLGMDALRGNCLTTYSWLGVIIFVAIAVQASAVALWFAFRRRGVAETLLGAVALGLATASMHYAAMEATHFLPMGNAAELVQGGVSKTQLALAIAITIYSVCGVCIFIFALRTFMRSAVVPARPRLN
jgi:NO-binding membrane sensor protein with MHYT domain